VDRINGSQHISDFLDYISDVQKKYKYYNDLYENENKVSQDLLHKLELEATGYKERNKIATILAVSRKDRRFYKDYIEELQPIYDLTVDQKHKAFFNQLREALGKVRKAEEYHKDRKYYPRVLRGE